MSYLARKFFHLLFLPLVWFIYRMRKTGLERVPRTGGVLLLCNHVSYIDSFIMYFACPRRLRFVFLEKYSKMKAIGWFLHLFGGIPIRPEHAREALMRTVDALKAGDAVCLFPEGALTRLGVTMEFKRGFEIIVRKAACEVVPVYMDGLWGSIFSYERDRYFKKWPKRPNCPLQIAFGHPIPPEKASLEAVRTAMWEMSGEAFAKRRDFDRPLECATIRALKHHPKQTLFAEYSRGGAREWTRAATLGLATSMARRWMNHPPENGDRIGILLPPGPMSSAINLGLFLAGKTPVNLPFTIDQRETEALAHGISPLGIRTVITSRAFMPHLMDFWQGDEGSFIDLKAVITPPGSVMALFERIRAFLEPAWLTCWRLDLNRRDPDREAVGLVTSPGDAPLFLTSRELFQNARSVVAANFVQEDDVIFNEEFLSSPEGLILGCWAPLLGKGRSVCRSFSQRTEFEPLEQSILEQGVTLVTGSAAFFRQVTHALGVRSLKYGILFGPANQWEIEDWEETMDLPLARAWSFHGRVVTMSRPDPNTGEGALHQSQKGRDPKSVGRLLPGLAAKVEASGIAVKFSPEGGWVRGPGDAEISEEGFVYIRNSDLA